MALILTFSIAALAGLHASTWGMYKDAPHEGFTRTKFLRSVTLAVLLGPVIGWLLGLEPVSAPAALLLFGSIYACERALTEAWKTFFRVENQQKYTIPMQFAVFGHPIESRWIRRVAGVVYLGIILAGVVGLSRLELPRTTSPVILAVSLGALGGWFSAVGGAWKDAPIEGFETLKFFRSPLLAALYAWPLFRLGGAPAPVMLAATGLTVATIETWKTFLRPPAPAGKFAGKPVRFPEMLERRVQAVPPYFGIWALVLAGFAAAFAGEGTTP